MSYYGRSRYKNSGWISENKGLIILAAIFLLTVLIGFFFQPWEEESIQTLVPDLIENAEEKGLDNIMPVIAILFKGANDMINSVSGAFEYIEFGLVYVMMMFFSVGFFFFMLIAGICARKKIFDPYDYKDEKIKNAVIGWLFDNVWLTAASYLWWLISKAVAHFPGAATVILGLLMLALMIYIIVGILLFLLYMLLLYGGCYLIINVCAAIPAALFPVRIAVMIALGLVIRLVIEYLIEKRLDDFELDDLLPML